nr:tetratricopeptide repeat protein [Nitrospinota bacterium]
MILSRFRLITAYLILFLFWVPTHAKSADLSEKTLIERELNTLAELPDSQIDLLDTLLLVSRHWDQTLQTQPLKDEISHLVLEVKKDLRGSDDAKKIVETLRHVIHNQAGYRYTEQVDVRGIPVNNEELFLHGMLKTKRGYCMNLSLLYLILGQKLNLPLFGVPLPNHFFARYENGYHRINIEATEGGTSFPDSFYRQRYLPHSEKDDSYFLNNLNAKKTLGAYFSNVGMVYYQNQKTEQAIFYLQLSTKINPRSIDAQNNLANIYSEQKKFKEAIRHYHLALKTSPGNISTLFNLGLVQQEKGDFEAAVESFLQVIQIDKVFTPAHQRLANLFLKRNQLISSLLHLKVLAKLQPESIQNKINIANAFGRLGQHPLALQTFKAILNQHPDNEKIHAGLAETYYRMNDFPHAIE